MRRRLRALARNPFTIVIPLVLVLWLGWGHYIGR